MRSHDPINASLLVWDVPTRLFHWLLVLLVALAWVTGEAEGSVLEVLRLYRKADRLGSEGGHAPVRRKARCSRCTSSPAMAWPYCWCFA